MIGVPFERRSTVRVGIIGLGNRGGSMIDLFLAMPGVRVVALCDPVKEKTEKAAKKVTAAGQPAPAVYTKGDHDFENLCKRGDIDFVYVGHALGLALRDGQDGDAQRQARGRGVPHRAAPGPAVGAGRSLRAHPQTLHAAGELLLRQERDAGAADGARGPVRRSAARRRRLQPRSARPDVRPRVLRGPMAPAVAHPAARRPLPQPRVRSGRQLHGRQPRRPRRTDLQLRHPRARPRRLPQGAHAGGRPELEGVVHRERPDDQPRPDRQGPGDPAGARCLHPAPLQPYQQPRRHQGRLRGLPASGSTWSRTRATTSGATSPSTRSGTTGSGRSTPTRPAGTAAWTTCCSSG